MRKPTDGTEACRGNPDTEGTGVSGPLERAPRSSGCVELPMPACACPICVELRYAGARITPEPGVGVPSGRGPQRGDPP